MRDMSNSDKSENASLKKQNERLTADLAHIVKDKESRIEEIEILNSEIIDLKDQVWQIAVIQSRQAELYMT